MRYLVRQARYVLLLGALFPPSAAGAQQQRPWLVKPVLTAAGEYDSNVFLLTPGQKSSVDAPPADFPTSRFANMESPSDVVTKVRGEVEFSGAGFGGHTLAITPELKYDHYAINAERSGPQIGVRLAQNLGRGSRFRVKAEMAPSTFFKNYLRDAIDIDGSGSITPDERIYAPASYAEQLIAADYRLRLKKSRKPSRAEIFLQFGGGYYRRSYDAPFEGRDRSGPVGSLGLKVDRGRSELELDYEFASLGAPPERVVRLLDEQNFGVDFNGNGSTSDPDARAFEMVDWSRVEHGLSLRARVPAGRRANLLLEYGHRRRSFASQLPFDAANNGRRDARHELGAGISAKVVPSVRFEGGLRIQQQSVNKPLDSAGDVTDYSRAQMSAGFRYSY